MAVEAINDRWPDKAQKKRQLHDSHGQSQTETRETAKRQKSEASVKDYQRYISPIFHGKRHSLTSTQHNTMNSCDIKRTKSAPPDGDIKRAVKVSDLPYIEPSLLRECFNNMHPQGPCRHLAPQPSRNREGTQATVIVKASTCGDEHSIASPTSLPTDSSISLSPHRLEPSEVSPSVLAHSSASFSHVIDGFRLTELERDMINCLLDLADPVPFSSGINGSAATTGSRGDVDVEDAPALWGNDIEHKYPWQSSAGVSGCGTDGEVKYYISRLIAAAVEQHEEDEADMDRVYPCVVIPASPFSDIDDFFELEDATELEYDPLPVVKSSSTRSQNQDAVEVVAPPASRSR